MHLMEASKYWTSYKSFQNEKKSSKFDVVYDSLLTGMKLSRNV